MLLHFFWGPWYPLTGLGGGPFELSVDVETESDAPSSFDGQITFFGKQGRQTKRFVGPGSLNIITAPNSWQEPKVSFKSHGPTGQVLRVTLAVRLIRTDDSLDGGEWSPKRKLTLWASEEDVDSLLRSDAYWNRADPGYGELRSSVSDWYRFNYSTDW